MVKENLISAKQVVFLMLTCILSTVDVLLPNQVAQIAGRDSWLAALVAAPVGFIIYQTIVALCLLFPEQSLVGINRKVLGRFLGGALSFTYVIGFLIFCTGGVVELSIIISTAFKPESAPYVWHLTVLIPALIVASFGISTPARMNEVLLPAGLLLLILVGILNINNLHLDEFEPVLQYGIMPTLEGALLTGGRLSYALFLLVLIPLITHKEKLPGMGIPSFIVIAISLLIGTLSIPIIGLRATQAEMFPALMMIRSIDVGFLTRMDPFMMMVWYTGFFIYLSVFSYAAAAVTRDLFHFKSYRWTLWFYGLVIFISANAKITSVSLIRNLLEYPLAAVLYFLSFIIPMFLYLVARLRGFKKA